MKERQRLYNVTTKTNLGGYLVLDRNRERSIMPTSHQRGKAMDIGDLYSEFMKNRLKVVSKEYHRGVVDFTAFLLIRESDERKTNRRTSKATNRRPGRKKGSKNRGKTNP